MIRMDLHYHGLIRFVLTQNANPNPYKGNVCPKVEPNKPQSKKGNTSTHKRKHKNKQKKLN